MDVLAVSPASLQDRVILFEIFQLDFSSYLINDILLKPDPSCRLAGLTLDNLADLQA
jgi:hypothetical protein